MADQYTPQNPSAVSAQPGPEQQDHPGHEHALQTPADPARPPTAGAGGWRAGARSSPGATRASAGQSRSASPARAPTSCSPTCLYAMFWLCKAAIPHPRPGSSIINTSSVQAYSPSPGLLDYATTKAGIVNFTRGLAQELAPKGIRVNTVAPGPVWTPLIPATMPPDMVDDFGSQTPLGRAGQPVEVAAAFVFLASAESSYVTGERIGVHGGMPLP